jgi:hypothetical protein
VRTVCFPGNGGGSDGWLCAGMGHGHVSLLDRRGGRLVAGFPAHDGAVTAAAVCGSDGNGGGGRAWQKIPNTSQGPCHSNKRNGGLLMSAIVK